MCARATRYLVYAYKMDTMAVTEMTVSVNTALAYILSSFLDTHTYNFHWLGINKQLHIILGIEYDTMTATKVGIANPLESNGFVKTVLRVEI